MNKELETYIIESSNDSIEHIEYTEPYEKKLLKHTPINSMFAKLIENDIEQSLIKNFESADNYYLWGVFSEFVGSTRISLYDDEEYLKKYPNGIYTGGWLFIPLPLFKNVIDNEPNHDEHKLNSSYILLSKFFNNIIENKYQIEFSKEEKEKIYGFILKQNKGYYKRHEENWDALLNLHKENFDIAFLNEEEFIKNLRNDKFSERTIEIFQNSKNNDDYIDDILSNCKEIRNNEHPLSKLINKVENKNVFFNEEEKNKITPELFEQYNYPYIGNSKKIINFMRDLAREAIDSDLAQSNPNVIKALDKKWITLSVKFEANKMFHILLNDVIELFKEKSLFSQSFNVSFVRTMANNPDFSLEHRDVCINLLSNTYMIKNGSFRKKYNIYTKNDFNIKNEFLKLCESGSLLEIENFINKYNIDININIENNQATKNILKRGDLNIIDYFFNKFDIDLDLNKISLLSMHEDSITYLYENGLFNIDKSKYGEIISVLCSQEYNNPQKDDKRNKLIEEIIFSPKTEEFIDEKWYGLSRLAENKNQDVNFIKKILDKLAEQTTDKLNLRMLGVLAYAGLKKNTDVINFFVFDLNLEIEEHKEEFFKEYPDIEKLFKMREFNKELKQELEGSPTQQSTKKSKI